MRYSMECLPCLKVYALIEELEAKKIRLFNRL